jgi:outer membrane protein
MSASHCTRLLALLTLLSLSAPAVRAAEMKIGYIDSQKILRDFRGTTEVQRQFDKEVESWRRQSQEKKKEIDDLKTAFDKQSLMLSDEARQEKETEIAQREREYTQFVQDVFGPNGKLEQRNAELTKPLVERINKILEKLGAEEDYGLILDTAQGGVAYAPKKSDLTQQVLDELNREAGYGALRTVAKRKIAVFNFEETTPEAEKAKLGTTIAQTFVPELSRTTRFEPVPRDTVDKLLKDRGLHQKGPLQEAEVLPLAKDLGGELALMGKVSKLETEIQVDVRILDVLTGGEVLAEVGKTKDEKGIQPMVQEIVRKLDRRLPQQ